jgi:hypothetical protein
MWKGLAAALIRALARVHRWNRMLGDGKYRSASEIAEAENVTRSFVNRLLRLTLLAPDIVKAILDGRQPKAMQLEELMKQMPSAWEEQRSALLRGAPPDRLRRRLEITARRPSVLSRGRACPSSP